MLQPIKDEKQYDSALTRIYTLMQEDLKRSSEETTELETLSILVKDYEALHYPVPNS